MPIFSPPRPITKPDQEAQAEACCKGFKDKYPDSIFVDEVPELEANVLLDLHDAAGAKRVLDAAASDPAAGRAGYQLAADLWRRHRTERGRHPHLQDRFCSPIR